MALVGLALSPSSNATDYYVDPLTGNMSNPGTAASPWSTLAAVAAAKTFVAGDHVYLRRGDHGTATITGINTGDVFVEAESGHTPVVRLSMINAHHWHIKGLTILGAVTIDNQTNENSDDNTFENCYMPSGGFQVCGNRITLRNNHIRAGGIHFLYHSNSGLVSGNTIEDFYSDAMNMKGNYNVFESNLVMNSHKVSDNHNDMFQGWATTGNVLRGNEFRAFSDPNQPDLVNPGVSDVQGIGLFDGFYTNWVIENNVVFVDHPIGIWIHGAKGCQVKNNTVVRCGSTAILDPRYPNIRVSAKKPGSPTGAPSTGNVVINNAAERFELSDEDNSGVSIGTVMNNVVVAKNAFGSTFLNWGQKDLHVKTGASIIDAGTSTNSPPTTDADGNARPFGAALDCGAFEYGYAPASADTTVPSKPVGLTAVIVPGFGVDLHWSPSTDNRKLAGYDIYRNGVWLDNPVKPHGGRTRAGTNYFDINADTTGSYTVQAFDHSGNRSPMSDPIGGTPPVPDTQAPSLPEGAAATPQSTTSILITWTASTDNIGVTGYDIWRDGSVVGSTGSTNYTDTGLTAATLCSYTITAKDFAGNVSDPSAPATATTLAPDLTPPSVPTNVTATPMSSGSIQLAWTASTDNRGVTGYQIYRDGVPIDTVAETSYADIGLVALTAYGYTVRALDADGNASVASSPPATTTTLEPAPVLAGESFEYTAAANLNGLNGGTGWAGPWAVGAASTLPATIESGNLGASPGLVAGGNHLKFWTAGNGNIYQNLDRTFESLIDDGGQTVWMAMVVGLCNAKNLAVWQLAGLTTDAAGTTVANLFETVANGTPTPFKFGSNTLFAGDTSFIPHLILVKIVMSGDASAETLTAYHNPNLAADPGTWTGVSRSLYANGGLIGFSYRGGRASTSTPNLDFHLDELRLARTWQTAVGQTGSPPADSEAPSVPSNVVAAAQSSTSILITWNASSDNVAVTSYEVYRGATLVGNPATTGFTDSGLAASTLYSYTVKAKDAAGNTSAASAAASATTQASVAPAAVIMEETFDYAAGNLVGLNGGTGWFGAWTVESHYDNEANCYSVIDGAFASYPGLISEGHYGSFLSGGGGTYYPYAQRLLTTPITDDGGAYWLAFQLQATAYHKYSSFTLLGTSVPLVYLKDDVAGMNFQFLGGSFHAPGDTNPHLFLIKIQMSGNANAENASLFYDPNLNADPATWTALRTGTFTMTGGALTGFRTDSARAGNAGYRTYIDELRLATTWQGAVGQSATTPIETWRQSKFGTTSNSGDAADDADPNHNGIINLMEYALGGEPVGHTTGLTILPQAERSAGNALRIRFTRYLDRTDLNLTAQAADSPAGPWSNLAVSTAGAPFAPGTTATETGTGNTRSVVATDLYPMDDPAHPKRFMRLKAER
jgi:chitodextrinase